MRRQLECWCCGSCAAADLCAVRALGPIQTQLRRSMNSDTLQQQLRIIASRENDFKPLSKLANGTGEAVRRWSGNLVRRVGSIINSAA